MLIWYTVGWHCGIYRVTMFFKIHSTCKKLGHGIYILRKLKDKVPINDLITIYKTIIQSHIDYCLTVWGPSNQLRRVHMLQNRIIRRITGLYNWNTSPNDLLRLFNILNVTQIRDYINCIQVFKWYIMSDMLHSPGEFNSYVTRNSNDSCGKLYVPKPRLELFRQGWPCNIY